MVVTKQHYRAITWLLLVQLFFNHTQIHAITYTNYCEYKLSIIIINQGAKSYYTEIWNHVIYTHMHIH